MELLKINIDNHMDCLDKFNVSNYKNRWRKKIWGKLVK